jgi:two-component system, OmpR family, sensor histidine kinase KdpD
MTPRVDQRRNPEQLLKQIEAEERDLDRGRLKVFLGYASGVGKSFRMLDEGRRRSERGQDVVLCATQPQMAEDCVKVLRCIEVIPPRDVEGVPVMDVDAILRRHPQVCLIDGLAYDNPPGSPNPKRWQDVRDLLQAGISVITSVNLQYIDEYREQVEKITGKRVTQTVPVAFLQTADEIVVVDTPPEFAINKARDSDSSPSIEQLEHRLSQLRELALLVAADVVDRQLNAALDADGIQRTWGTQERILVCLTPRANASKMIASARRTVERFHGELFAVYVTQPEISPEDQAGLERNLDIARQAGAKVEMLDGLDAVDAILDFARAHGITQIFIGHTQRQGWWSRFNSSPVDRLLERAGNIDVQVFPH